MEKEQANLDFVEAEHKVLDFWKNEKCFDKLVEKNKDGKPAGILFNYYSVNRFNFRVGRTDKRNIFYQ